MVETVSRPAGRAAKNAKEKDGVQYRNGAGRRLRSGQPTPEQQKVAAERTRWEENTVHGTWQSSTTHTDSFRSLLPGVELSAGFRARFWKALGTDFALRLTSTADPGEHDLGSFSSGKFHGLDELALVGGITWSP